MEYTIVCKGDYFVMGEYKSAFIGDLLFLIAEKHNMYGSGIESESHLLAVLREKGIKINIVEENGEGVVW